VTERNDEPDILDRATGFLLNDPVPPVPPALIQRTQFTLRGRAASAAASHERSPFAHPLLRIAAVIALATAGLATYLALRPSRTPILIAEHREGPDVPPVIQAPGPEPVVAQGDGSVRGMVRLIGVAPTPQVLSMASNAHCAAHHNGQVMDESVVVNADGTLRNVVIWVSGGLKDKRFPPPEEPAVLDQQGCVYTPHIVTVMAGQRLLVKNSDEFLHNVRAAAASNPPFNFAQPTISRGTPLVFQAPERLFVKCDIHPWMSAFIHVMDSPYFAVTGDRGAFRLPDLPPGEYEVSAWHEVYGEQKQTVRVESGKPLDMQFTFKPMQRAVGDVQGQNAGGPTCCEQVKPTLFAAGK